MASSQNVAAVTKSGKEFIRELKTLFPSMYFGEGFAGGFDVHTSLDMLLCNVVDAALGVDSRFYEETIDKETARRAIIELIRIAYGSPDASNR